MSEDLNKYASSLLEETQLRMDEYPNQPDMAFTAVVLESIEGMLDCQDIRLEHCKLTTSDGKVIGEIHAYATSNDNEALYLFYTDFNPSMEVKRKSNTECQTNFKRPQGFYNKAIRAGYIDLDDDSPEYRATKFIYDNQSDIQTVHIVVLSNFSISNAEMKSISIGTKQVFSDVWDLKKLYGVTHSMSDHIAIDIDFTNEVYARYKIPFIQMESTQYGYKCIQAMIPAKLLFQLYERHNTNILYSNVRYFLGLKGTKDKKPNVAMLETLRKENEMFLAYNNGITALASSIEAEPIGGKTDVTDPDSTMATQYITMGTLRKICDFRIINGGQTTATIFAAKKLSDTTQDASKKVNLLGVFVQMKLIIANNMEAISSNVTRSSNFQNAIKMSDFSVGNKINTTLEELSRKTRVPSPNNEPTYWFYERLRGQYEVNRKNLHTKEDKDYFNYQFPKARVFKKEDVAKVWANWHLQPYDAVKGASTTYGIFMKAVNGLVPDETYYKKIIALLIIQKFLLSRPENKQYTNGKATVVAYAMAMLNYLTTDRFNLLKVWDNQCLSDNAKIYLNKLCDKIYAHLYHQAVVVRNTTILSYGKSKDAFKNLQAEPLDIDFHLLDNDKL